MGKVNQEAVAELHAMDQGLAEGLDKLRQVAAQIGPEAMAKVIAHCVGVTEVLSVIPSPGAWYQCLFLQIGIAYYLRERAESELEGEV